MFLKEDTIGVEKYIRSIGFWVIAIQWLELAEPGEPEGVIPPKFFKNQFRGGLSNASKGILVLPPKNFTYPFPGGEILD